MTDASSPSLLTHFLFSLFSFQGSSLIVGADGDEGTPVPIPNTEVKLIYADDTWLEAARENKKVLTPKPICQSTGRFFFLTTRTLRPMVKGEVSHAGVPQGE